MNITEAAPVATPTPIVMKAGFSPSATVASLIATLTAVGTYGLTIVPQLAILLDANHPGLSAHIGAVAAILAGLGSIHLSMSRSLLPAVDGTKAV